MLSIISHRGPDAEGSARPDPLCILGNKRLSIIDLSERANQPMSFRDKWIVYNGEVYNFCELRDGLAREGYSFTTTSDTEVVLKLFDKFGIGAFSRLKGMFAVAIWDNQTKQLILARDPNSIKPLYYAVTDQALYFGSEVRQFRALGRFKDDPDWKVLFLTFGCIPFEKTTLSGVSQLKGGSYAVYAGGKLAIKRYEPQYTQETDLKSLFNRGIKSHIVSDAPLGIFLSGGIDSSLITLTARQFKDEIKTLSIAWGEGDESKYQHAVSALAGSNHVTYRLGTNEFRENFDDFFRAMDQPTVDGINTYFISKCAKQSGLKAVLSGIGADEIALGYKHYHKFNRYKTAFNHPRFLRLFAGFNTSLKIGFAREGIPPLMQFYLFVRGIFPPPITARILGISEQSIVDLLMRLCAESLPTLKIDQSIEISAFNYLERQIYMNNQLLKDADFMGMHHSIEIRVPYLDLDFSQRMIEIPPGDKLRGPVNKPVLVGLNDKLPPEICMREKRGFTLPFDSWLSDSKDIVSHALNQLGDRQLASLLHNKFESGSLHWSKIWTLVVATCFRA